MLKGPEKYTETFLRSVSATAFNRLFKLLRCEILRDINGLKCLVESENVSKKFKSVAIREIALLEVKNQEFIDNRYKKFCETMHYIWNSPDKETELVIETEQKDIYDENSPGKPLVLISFKFSGELGKLFCEVSGFEDTLEVYFHGNESVKNKLNNSLSYENFKSVLLENFVVEPANFKKWFSVVETSYGVKYEMVN